MRATTTYGGPALRGAATVAPRRFALVGAGCSAAARRRHDADAAPRCPRACSHRRGGGVGSSGRNSGSGSRNNSSGSNAADDMEGQPVMVNDHTLWLAGPGSARPVVFGDGYTLFPPSTATTPTPTPAPTTSSSSSSTGLVPWVRGGRLAPFHASGSASGSALHDFAGAALAVVPALGETGIVPFSGEPVVLRGSGFVEAIDTVAEVLPAAGPATGDLPPLPPSTTAIVRRPPAGLAAPAGAAGADSGEEQGGQWPGDLHAAAGGGGGGGAAAAGPGGREEGGQEVYESFNSASPRRGHKVKFTCRRCGATSIRPINIHAFREGTVFARCGRCKVTHKLVDNLKLIHELSGPVFNTPSAPLPADALPPELRLRLGEEGEGGGGVGVAGGRVGGYEGWRLWSPSLNGEPPSSSSPPSLDGDAGGGGGGDSA